MHSFIIDGIFCEYNVLAAIVLYFHSMYCLFDVKKEFIISVNGKIPIVENEHLIEHELDRFTVPHFDIHRIKFNPLRWSVQ